MPHAFNPSAGQGKAGGSTKGVRDGRATEKPVPNKRRPAAWVCPGRGGRPPKPRRRSPSPPGRAPGSGSSLLPVSADVPQRPRVGAACPCLGDSLPPPSVTALQLLRAGPAFLLLKLRPGNSQPRQRPHHRGTARPAASAVYWPRSSVCSHTAGPQRQPLAVTRGGSPGLSPHSPPTT